MEIGTNNNVGYNIDLVLCIDGTGSMSGIIEHVKSVAKEFYGMVIDAMTKAGKAIKDDEFRVRCVVFRDYGCDGEKAMEESRFFSVADEAEAAAFEAFVSGITAEGGGDGPENALEAIFTAMKSDWNPRGGRFRRQIIVVFTDAPFLPLHESSRVAAPIYPLDAPKTLEELQTLFEKGDQTMMYAPKNGRLIIYAPKDGTEWPRFKTWERTWFVPTKDNGGCEEVDMNEALAVVVGSC